MKSVRSGEVGRLCLELTRLIEHDLVDYEDSRVVDRLMNLNRVLFSAVERIKVPA
jgi:hypothetical protein